MSGLGPAFERWFFEPREQRALGLTRIALGSALAYALVLLAPHLTLLFGDAGVVPLAAHQASAWWPAPTVLSLTGATPLAVWSLWGLTLAAAVVFALGLRTRIAAVVLYVGLLSLHDANTFAVNGGDVIARNLVFWLILAPMAGGGAFSLDRRRQLRLDPDAPPVVGLPWAQRMAQLQVAILYLSTSGWKLLSPRWHDGSALHEIASAVEFLSPGVEQLLAWPELSVPLSYLVMVGELAIGPLLLIRRTRWLGIALGLGIHGTIMIFMRIPVFGAVMWASYLAFLDEDQVRRLLAVLGRRRGAR